MSSSQVLERLADVIAERRRTRPEGSYVASLFAGGHPRIAAKVREESEELIEAAAAEDAAHTAHEAADLLFHVLVLLEQAQVPLARVLSVLEGRFGVGGLTEKAARTAGAEPGDG